MDENPENLKMCDQSLDGFGLRMQDLTNKINLEMSKDDGQRAQSRELYIC